MCNKLCTYRKWIQDDGSSFNCTENPHIILGAKAVQVGGGAFSTISPSGTSYTNLYSTTFHLPYFEIWNNYVQYINGSGFPSVINTPYPTGETSPGTYDTFDPSSGLPVTKQFQITHTFPIYTSNIAPPLVSNFLAYAPPPWDFAQNIHSSEYVPGFNYFDLNLVPSQSTLNFIFVEFLDVTGKYCQYA